ncbi:phage tail tip lysozyme [Trinickia acidisoli]|uniref:phage tail tip lysozyme n=1 Tax=Trinickia acidisoli TaxID=2767482 RepID=UPI001F5D0D3B|nr:phage tail tip lysozyme [Trinickia acidisoli]
MQQLLDSLLIKLLMKMYSSSGTGTSHSSFAHRRRKKSTQSTSDDTVPTNSSSNTAQAVTSDLEQRYGLTATQAAGALGNLQQESGLQCNVNQGGSTGAPSNCGGADGYGLAQWGGDRKEGEIAYAQKHNLDPGSQQANIGFMNQELDGPYSKTITDLKKTNNVNAATQVWDTDYEQAGTPNMANRDQYAENFLSEGL